MRHWLLLSVLTLAGCNSSKDTPPQGHSHDTKSTAKHDHDHKDKDDDDHDENVEHAGPYHVKLTSHLSAKDGNELDIEFETAGKTPKPVALEHKTISAKVKREGDPKEYDITFEPAPADERPKDEKPGTCSHYVAKAPFIKDTDKLTVTMKVVVREKERTVTWENFDVKKFSHKH